MALDPKVFSYDIRPVIKLIRSFILNQEGTPEVSKSTDRRVSDNQIAASFLLSLS